MQFQLLLCLYNSWKFQCILLSSYQLMSYGQIITFQTYFITISIAESKYRWIDWNLWIRMGWRLDQTLIILILSALCGGDGNTNQLKIEVVRSNIFLILQILIPLGVQPTIISRWRPWIPEAGWRIHPEPDVRGVQQRWSRGQTELVSAKQHSSSAEKVISFSEICRLMTHVLFFKIWAEGTGWKFYPDNISCHWGRHWRLRVLGRVKVQWSGTSEEEDKGRKFIPRLMLFISTMTLPRCW